MNRDLLRIPAVAALVCASLLAAAAPATATRPVDLRVLSSSGAVLAEHRQYTGDPRIPTDPGAECFGPGTGGSGDPFRLGEPTALGAIADSRGMAPELQPLAITDYYLDSFGPGVCGIGGHETSGSAYWYLKVDHVGSTIGGGQPVAAGNDVLWYLTPAYPPGKELLLRAPAGAQAGEPFRAEVLLVRDDGTRRPAAGASVTGALSPTNARGVTRVVAANDIVLRATRAGEIPSNRVPVCVAANVESCPAHRGRTIFGSQARDGIDGTSGPDVIRARDGNDVVRADGGGADDIVCGPGELDKAVVSGPDTAVGCEELVRK